MPAPDGLHPIASMMCDARTMVPIRYSWLFRSRWIALAWAASMIWFALEVTGSLDQPQNATDELQITDASGVTLRGEDAEKAVGVLKDWGGN